MPDYANCQLLIWGLTTSQAFDEIVNAIETECLVYSERAREQLLGWAEIDIDKLRIGNIPASLNTALHHSGLGYFWNWSYPPHVQGRMRVFDPLTDDAFYFHTSDGEITIPLSRIEDDEFVHRARSARDVIATARDIGFAIADTAHETVEAVDKNPALAPFAARRAERG